MPAGLDGNPNPIDSPARRRVISAVAARVEASTAARVAVGVDGRSGTGKSTFAYELSEALRNGGASVVRSTTDSFHRPRAERMRLGETSPDGYYRDSHQITTITDELLAPFRDGAPTVLVEAFDEPSDSPNTRLEEVPERAVLVFDGLFALRPEFRPFWDVTIMLCADRRCDTSWLRYLETDLPTQPTERATEIDRRLSRARWPRYREGWERYLEAVREFPADIVIDNDDLAHPTIDDR